MISYTKAHRALEIVRAKMKRDELPTDYVRGIIVGLTIALSTLKGIWQATGSEKFYVIQRKGKQ